MHGCMHAALAPCHNILARPNMSLNANDTVQHPTCLTHYDAMYTALKMAHQGNPLALRDILRDADDGRIKNFTI